MDKPGPRIAIVDDDETVRRALRRMVSSLGYLPVEFPSGRALLSALEHAGFACVLLDLHMPDLNAIDVLSQMRSDGSRTSVIVITGAHQPKMRTLCMEAGASDYLVKPLARDVVFAAIERLSSLSPTEEGS